MKYESALVKFRDGYEISIPLTAGPVRERSWTQMCRFACDYVRENTGSEYAPRDVVSVRIREGTGG